MQDIHKFLGFDLVARKKSLILQNMNKTNNEMNLKHNIKSGIIGVEAVNKLKESSFLGKKNTIQQSSNNH